MIPPFRTSSAALLAALLLAAGCQEPSEPPPAPPAEGPTGEALAGIARASLDGSHVQVNADTLLDVLGARVSALASGDSAQGWVQRRLEAYGVPRVGLESLPLLAWDRREAALEVRAPEGGRSSESLRILSLGHVGSYDIEAPLVDAGYGTAEEIEASGERVEGAVVLADVGSPSGYGRGVHRTEKVTLATAAGAVGFIQLNTAEGRLIPVGVATLGDEETEIPAVAGDRATGQRLRALLDEAGEVRVRLSVENWMERTRAANVLGEIPGRSEEIVLVGAPIGLGAMGRPEAEPFLGTVQEAMVEAGFELDGELSTAGGIYSDHQPFLVEGIPVLVVRSRQPPEASGVSHTTADTRDALERAGEWRWR